MKTDLNFFNPASNQRFTSSTENKFEKLNFLNSYFSGHKGFIAGGCFKDIFTGNKVKDLDFFFVEEQDFVEAENYFFKQSNYKPVYSNDNASSFLNTDTDVRIELIKRIFGSPEYVVSQFDFSVSKFAYIKLVKYDRLWEQNTVGFETMHALSYFEDLAQKILRFDNEIVNPAQTLERLLRYTKYGFNLDMKSRKRLLNELANMDKGLLDDLSDENYF